MNIQQNHEYSSISYDTLHFNNYSKAWYIVVDMAKNVFKLK